MKVNVEEVEQWLRFRERVNDMPLDQIQWYRNGERIEIPTAAIEDWKFIGLSNVCFAEMGFPAPEQWEQFA